ncbi:DUF11 domain-containing protein [Candidatus Kaiserbacteria bacterium]|nr:DUF11 domain-containing protein [Candidatus Kaiserbacteria bacterium]
MYILSSKQNKKSHKLVSLTLAIILVFQLFLGSLSVAEAADVEFEAVTEVTPTEAVVKEVAEDNNEETDKVSDDDSVDESKVNPTEAEKEVKENDGSEGEDNGEGESVVVTGEALAGTELLNELNTNELTTAVGTSSESGEMSEASDDDVMASSTQSATSSSSEDNFFDDLSKESPSTIKATNTSEANLENNLEVETNTGSSTASGGEALVSTGNAYAIANVVNLVNTNIINSNGFIEFFSSLGFSNIDLRNMFDVFRTAESTIPCLPSVCGDNGIVYNVNNDNNATINNNISVLANTGGNSANGNQNALIQTGDAYAVANVFNIANTNITDSNYLLLSFSNLGDLNSDIVLPNSNIFQTLFGSRGGARASVSNTNIASTTNALSVSANTGDNQTDGGVILTGEAKGSGSVVNQINQNFFGADTFRILLRVHGDWSGSVYGLPEGMSWAETDQGIQLFMNPEAEGSGGGTGYNVTNTNQATINNNVSVMALTGDNKVSGGNSAVLTGDAYAAGNIMNVVNTNVLGQNWALLVFDIFGDWSGDISFGRPDLWVGGVAHSNDSPIMPGSSVDYTFTVMNLGDSPAKGVVLENAFHSNYLNVPNEEEQTINQYTKGLQFAVGDLEPGESKEITFRAKVDESLLRYKKTNIEMLANVYAETNEDNLDNNKESVTVIAGTKKKDSEPSMTFAGKMYISKTASVKKTTLPAKVTYTINLVNKGGPIYGAVLRDVLENSEGLVLSQEDWELGDIMTGETIEVSYDIDYQEGMEGGVYTNTAQLAGYDRSRNLHYRQQYLSDVATADVEIIGGKVLGLATSVCPAYLENFLGQGYDNDSEDVLKLQSFLKNVEDLDVDETGEFDSKTHQAVKVFQDKYKTEVLTPWGMAQSSGYVYLTTRKKINELACGETISFPLTRSQENEISRFRFASSVPLEGEEELVTVHDVPAIVPEPEEVIFEKPLATLPKEPDLNPSDIQTASTTARFKSWMMQKVRLLLSTVVSLN